MDLLLACDMQACWRLCGSWGPTAIQQHMGCLLCLPASLTPTTHMPLHASTTTTPPSTLPTCLPLPTHLSPALSCLFSLLPACTCTVHGRQAWQAFLCPGRQHSTLPFTSARVSVHHDNMTAWHAAAAAFPPCLPCLLTFLFLCASFSTYIHPFLCCGTSLSPLCFLLGVRQNSYYILEADGQTDGQAGRQGDFLFIFLCCA